MAFTKASTDKYFRQCSDLRIIRCWSSEIDRSRNGRRW